MVVSSAVESFLFEPISMWIAIGDFPIEEARNGPKHSSRTEPAAQTDMSQTRGAVECAPSLCEFYLHGARPRASLAGRILQRLFDRDDRRRQLVEILIFDPLDQFQRRCSETSSVTAFCFSISIFIIFVTTLPSFGIERFQPKRTPVRLETRASSFVFIGAARDVFLAGGALDEVYEPRRPRLHQIPAPPNLRASRRFPGTERNSETPRRRM
ncbi:hypothetical protein [Methylosinus sp. Ce-a6]|uniref:hypothetical protein n=1 Tax=Methylosinus sp. Ce-a6 TaxID=2172005 RepID=UPI001358E29C|nr:hypothetical protein [Methylosinus sp. Ce-a6]